MAEPKTTAVTPEPKVIEGDDLVILTNQKSIYHAESHKLSVSPEIKEFRTKDTGGKRRAAGDMNWSVSVSGLVCVKGTIGGTDIIDTNDMLDITLRGEEVTIVTSCSELGLVKKTGKGMVTSFEIDAPTGEKAKYSATIEGTGLTPVV